VIHEAARSHPFVVEEGIRRPSPSYRGLPAIESPFADPLPAPPASVQERAFGSDTLGLVRRLVATRGAEAGLNEMRRRDLVLAVNEIATNSVRHAGGSGTLRIWMGTRWLVSEVEDHGRIEDPLAGREPPSPEQLDGRGLWIANQICDLVPVRTFPQGSLVRMHLRRS
jgi:anti-sigma regulatory factor (Ser/Thr protein kinase)